MINRAVSSALEPEEMPQDDAGFLAVVRTFFDQALTPELRQAGRETLGVHSDIGTCKVWHRRLYERGWIAPAWLVAFGGNSWSARQRFLFDRECARQDAPVLFIGGIRSLGPLLIEQGTPEQRARFLTPMLQGRDHLFRTIETRRNVIAHQILANP